MNFVAFLSTWSWALTKCTSTSMPFEILTLFNFLMNVRVAHILVNDHIKLQIFEWVSQIFAINIGARSRFQRRNIKVFMIKYDGHATLIVSHIVFGCITFRWHTRKPCIIRVISAAFIAHGTLLLLCVQSNSMTIWHPHNTKDAHPMQIKTIDSFVTLHICKPSVSIKWAK